MQDITSTTDPSPAPAKLSEQKPLERDTTSAEKSSMGSEKDLMRSLMRELFQTERSAQRHPRVEAERLVDTPPGRILQAIARHADAVVAELPGRARQHDLPISAAGLAMGSTFSQLRRRIVDLFMDLETSYRATLLGLRHGLDVMRMLREAALAAGDEELSEWCDRIYQARLPLIEEGAQQLSWFAKHADQAVSPVMGGLVAKGIELLKERLSRAATSRSERASSHAA